MSGGGSDAPPPPGPSNGGEFLLSLLQRPHHLAHGMSLHGPHQPQSQPITLDPAVAAVGPSLPIPLPRAPSAGSDPSFSWLHGLSPPPVPPVTYPHSYGPQEDLAARLGLRFGHDSFSAASSGLQNLRFGTFPLDSEPFDRLPNGNLIESQNFDSAVEHAVGHGSRGYERSDRNWQINGRENLNYSNSSSNASLLGQQNSDSRNFEQLRAGHAKLQSGHVDNRLSAPPGFQREVGSGGYGRQRRGGFSHNAGQMNGNHRDLNNRNRLNLATGNMRPRGLRSDGHRQVQGEGILVKQLHPEVQSVHSSRVDKSSCEVNNNFHAEGNAVKDVEDLDDLFDSLSIEDPLDEKSNKNLRRLMRDKEYRSDPRGQLVLNQRMRNHRRMMDIRSDINRLNDHFLLIYESLIPPEEEKAKQKQLLSMLERLVNKEWPEARVYLYGSCANSFGVCKSDIDVCLEIQDPNMSKSELIEKLADILESDNNLQNVQALAHARVPIVKLMDQVTGLACDICINNVLAVTNTKLLRDYAEIDVRLRQLAYIVKHWAKSRRVNETYQGTLSSYAYVLMCIHFLQQRRPAILPCLQKLEPTYSVTANGIHCAYFDQVEKLRNYGAQNRETISQLVWGFFNYWAYCHDYTHSVISVRSGCLLSKQVKDWTRRIGNDRHLICIEDPFDTNHDLGRVVDKFSIKVLREEFERAADVMQHDPSPWITLFEPYVLS